MNRSKQRSDSPRMQQQDRPARGIAMLEVAKPHSRADMIVADHRLLGHRTIVCSARPECADGGSARESRHDARVGVEDAPGRGPGAGRSTVQRLPPPCAMLGQ